MGVGIFPGSSDLELLFDLIVLISDLNRRGMVLRKELFANLKGLNKLIPITGDSLLKMKNIYPNVPQEYIDFMMDFGSGELGDGAYMIYSELTDPSTVYGGDFNSEDVFLLIGDDFSGCCSGFRLSDWSIVEFYPATLHPIKVADSFSEFIYRKIKWSAQ